MLRTSGQTALRSFPRLAGASVTSLCGGPRVAGIRYASSQSRFSNLSEKDVERMGQEIDYQRLWQAAKYGIQEAPLVMMDPRNSSILGTREEDVIKIKPLGREDSKEFRVPQTLISDIGPFDIHQELMSMNIEDEADDPLKYRRNVHFDGNSRYSGNMNSSIDDKLHSITTPPAIGRSIGPGYDLSNRILDSLSNLTMWVDASQKDAVKISFSNSPAGKRGKIDLDSENKISELQDINRTLRRVIHHLTKKLYDRNVIRADSVRLKRKKKMNKHKYKKRRKAQAQLRRKLKKDG